MLLDVEIFHEFTGDITFEIRAIMAVMSPEHSVGGSRTNENNRRQKTAFAACRPELTLARCQYSPLVY